MGMLWHLFDLNQDEKKSQASQLEYSNERLKQLEAEIAQFRANVKSQPTRRFDCFISHISADKDTVVRPLAARLAEKKLKVWYDEFQIKIGDSIRESLDKGLANSRFGIIVLSPGFLDRPWTKYELDGLLSKEAEQGNKVLLPIWHKITKDDIIEKAPSLVGRFALNTANSTIEEIAEAIADVVHSP